MVILIYIGVILFCYGIYNIFSYYSAYPTATVQRSMKKWRRSYNNDFIIELSRYIVKKWDLGWKGSESLTEIMHYNKIYYPATIYCVSLVLTVFCGLFLCLPLLFWNRIWFVLLSAAVLVYVSSVPFLLLLRYRKSSAAIEKTDSKQKSSMLNMKKLVRLLPGVFFLCQILLIFLMLT